jgi:hypothetical protein
MTASPESSRYRLQFLYEDEHLRVHRLQSTAEDSMWSARLATDVAPALVAQRLEDLGMRCVKDDSGVWELELVGEGDVVHAKVLVMETIRMVVIRIEPSVHPDNRRGTASRIARSIAMVIRTFARRSWRPRRPSSPRSLAEAS